MREKHPLFERYPLDGKVQVGGRTETTPYHIYNGSIAFIGGTANAAVATDLLRQESLTPLLDSAGNALMAVWLCDFTAANLDPHHELQISIFATFRPQPPVQAHPFAIYRALTLNPDMVMVCHGLWNNTERVVQYNREHLGLDAHLSKSQITRDDGAALWRFRVEDAQRSALIAEGQIATVRRQPPAAMWAMSGHLGMGGLLRLMREPFIHVPVVNTRSTYATTNRIAHTYTRSDRQVVRFFGTSDRLTLADRPYAALGFRPQFVQQNEGVRFVYLRPESAPTP